MNLQPIGYIRSTLRALSDAPRQGSEGAPDAWLDLDVAYADGLLGIKPGDELLVITWLHRADREVLQRHSLGLALLAAGQAREAEVVYREDLERFPRNGWSLFGLAQSLEQQGRRDEASRVRAEFDAVWRKADVKLTGSRL